MAFFQSVGKQTEPEFLPDVTGYTGGGSTNLDGLNTVGILTPLVAKFYHSTDGLVEYTLRSGTTAESSPSVIRPDDYNATTNAKYWEQNPIAKTSGALLDDTRAAIGGTRTENANSGTGDSTATAPSFSGDFTGQIALTNYGRFWWWNSAAWRSELVISRTLTCDGRNHEAGDSNHLLAVGSASVEIDNCLELRNMHNNRHSAVRCTDLNGDEKCAWGYGNPGANDEFADASYWEGYGGAVDLRMVVNVNNGVTCKLDKTSEDFIYYKQGATHSTQDEAFRIFRDGTGIRLGDPDVTTSPQIQGLDANHAIIFKDATENCIGYYEFGRNLSEGANAGHTFYTGGVKASQTRKFQICNDYNYSAIPMVFGSDASGPRVHAGSGTPEGAVTAPVGSIYMRSDGGASTSLYVKESGTGNTGWVAK